MRTSANKILGLIVAAALAFGLAPGGLVAYGNDAKAATISADASRVNAAVEDDAAAASDGVIEPASLEVGDSIYVNGQTGNDANSGTEEEPVKTFFRAKELMEQWQSDIIWVTGALEVSGTTETWDLGGKMIMRDGLYNGELVRVSDKGSLTLKNIVIDGGCKNGATGIATSGDGGGGSLVTVRGSSSARSSLTVGEGAILRNNVIRVKDMYLPESGGGVFAAYSDVDVEGGTITGNQAVYGGGICAVYDSMVTMSSGTISDNSAVEAHAERNTSATQRGYSGTGGGVCVWRGATMYLSGGTISGNKAFNRGGGISLGGLETFPYDNQSTLTMTGGTISGNTAGSAGGGLFVQSGIAADAGYGPATYCVATITGGTFSGNRMTDEGDSSSAFGGGAIYVNGIGPQFAAFHNGELYLEKAEISGNTASIAGGGYAGCPVSQTHIYLTNGSVFYGNKTDDGNAREIYILASNAYGNHSGDPFYEISPSMLGGGAYGWLFNDGSEVPQDKLTGTLSAIRQESLSLNNTLSAADSSVQTGLGIAQVHIVNNESETRGGGIGTNGSVFIGKESETIGVSVAKQWEGEDGDTSSRPESVVVELYRDGVYVGYQTVKPDEDGNWSATFGNLPKADADGNSYAYTVKEREVEGYTSKVEGDAASGFTITNTLRKTPPTPEPEPTPTPEPTPEPPAPTPTPEPTPEPATPSALDKTGDDAGLVIAVAGGACVAAAVAGAAAFASRKRVQAGQR